jgi:hypothetical protein
MAPAVGFEPTMLYKLLINSQVAYHSPHTGIMLHNLTCGDFSEMSFTF